jgi:hypothetical protein
MKKFMVAAVAALSITALACTSVESAKVDAATIASNGEAVAVVQATTLGIYILFNFVALVESNLDVAVNKTLVTEAKALGGNKVQLLTTFEYPKGGLFKWFGPGPFGLNILNLSPSFASGIAVK